MAGLNTTDIKLSTTSLPKPEHSSKSKCSHSIEGSDYMISMQIAISNLSLK